MRRGENRLLRLIAELRRRNVVRVSVGYAGTAAVCLNLVDHLVSGGVLPREVYRFVVVAAVAFFPVAAVLAWKFELTQEGPRRTRAMPARELRRWSRGWSRPSEAKDEGHTLRTAALVVTLLVAVVWTAFRLDVAGLQQRFPRVARIGLIAGEPPATLEYPEVGGGADVGATFVLRFSERVRGSTVSPSSVRLLGPEGVRVPAEVRPAREGRAAEIVPRDSLAYEAEYRVELSEELRSAGGEPVVPGPEVVATFRTQPRPPDREPPRVAEARPEEGAEGVSVGAAVELTFSEPVNPATVDTASVRLQGPGGRVPARLFCCAGLRTLRLEPREELEHGEAYAAVLDSGVADRAGNRLRPDTVVFWTEAPRVVRRPEPRREPPSGPSPEAEAEEPTGPGVLDIAVEPARMRERVRVWVEGENLGPPPVPPQEVEPGRSHTVRVVGVTKFSAHTITLHSSSHSVAPGDTLGVPVEVGPFGEISVNATPGGVVYIDGERVGGTPLGGYPVRAGTHVLEVRPSPSDSAAHGTYRTTLEVTPFETHSLGSVRLPPK